jgi:hypothetical protein
VFVTWGILIVDKEKRKLHSSQNHNKMELDLMQGKSTQSVIYTQIELELDEGRKIDWLKIE